MILIFHSEEKRFHILITHLLHVMCSLMLLLRLCFYQPAVDLRHWLCRTAVYRFREVISTSQESKSMGSRDTKSPCDFLSFISLPSASTPLYPPLYVSVCLVSSIFPFLVFLCRICIVIPSHTTTLPTSRFLSSPLPTRFLSLQPTVCSETSTPVFLLFYVIPASQVIMRHSARTNNSLQPCLYQSRMGAAITAVSSQLYS